MSATIIRPESAVREIEASRSPSGRIGTDRALFNVWIHQPLVFPLPQSDTVSSGILSMSVSSIAAPAAVQPAHNTPQANPPDPSNDNDADDAGAAQPAAPAPLPPGQGTRIDQLV